MTHVRMHAGDLHRMSMRVFTCTPVQTNGTYVRLARPHTYVHRDT